MAAMAAFTSQLRVCTKNTFVHCCVGGAGEDLADGLMTRSLSCPAIITDVEMTVPCRAPCPMKSSFEQDDRYSSVSTANQDGSNSSPCESDVECLSESLSLCSRTNSPLNGSRTNSPCNLGVIGVAVPMVLAPTVVPVIPQRIQVVEIPMPMLQQAVQQPSAPADHFDHSGPAGQGPMSSADSHAAPAVPPANEAARASKTSAQQKRINRELVAAGKRSSLQVLKVVARSLGQMNGVNLATSFHRISRAGEELLRVSSPGVFSSLLEMAEHFAEWELANRDASVPANCCTIIAWSCAQLRVFRPSLFAKLAAVATPQLHSCQPYEVTNLLWAFAEFYKFDQDTASDAAPELRALLDAVADVFSRRSHGDFKVQVLTSALMSVSSLPWDQSFSKTWLLNSTFQELSSRWEEMELEGQAGTRAAACEVQSSLQQSKQCRPEVSSRQDLAGSSCLEPEPLIASADKRVRGDLQSLAVCSHELF
mmetsp:Transcript_122780/g.292041  ORF Transcript_122780/g.292041 Transcript_122780/m.292041 type:complete len:480 (+) Transcript_122780:73-1512(+)